VFAMHYDTKPKPKILIALFKEENEKLIVRRKKIDFDDE